jgi:hypothetical protein
MSRLNILVAVFFCLQENTHAQTIESTRAFAFDRGLIDASEPFSPAGNPALLFERQSFRFYAEWQRANTNSYLMSFAYPLSAKMGLGLTWHSLRTSGFQVFPNAAFSTSYTKQTFLLGLGSKGRMQWGQQFEVTLEANRAFLLTGDQDARPPFLNDQRIRFIYRLGFYQEISPHVSCGLLTPPLIRFDYRSFLDAPLPAQSSLTFGEPTRHRIWTPRIAVKWQPNEFAALALSSRSLEVETDTQLAAELHLLKNFNLTAAFARASDNQHSKLIFGMGGNIGGFDAFAAYEAREQDFRIAISFAPERAKELIEVGEFTSSTPILYPYRLKHNVPAWLSKIELINKTAKPVEVAMKVSGHDLPTIRKGITLNGDKPNSLEVPISPNLQKLLTGQYNYTIELTAFQRGRQEIRRQFSFEMKDSHDWSGDSNDLNYFIQPHETEILQTARTILSECGKGQAVLQSISAAQCFYNFLKNSFRYVHDPRPLHARQDRVQYATETLRMKSGDCEDLTILMVSLLESVGIRAAFVEVNPPQSEEGHIFLLFDSQAAAAGVAGEDNLQRYVVRQNDALIAHLFIPLELTQLDQPFEQARLHALSVYQKYGIDQHGLAMGWVKIIDTPGAE